MSFSTISSQLIRSCVPFHCPCDRIFCKATIPMTSSVTSLSLIAKEWDNVNASLSTLVSFEAPTTCLSQNGHRSPVQHLEVKLHRSDSTTEPFHLLDAAQHYAQDQIVAWYWRKRFWLSMHNKYKSEQCFAVTSAKSSSFPRKFNLKSVKKKQVLNSNNVHNCSTSHVSKCLWEGECCNKNDTLISRK